MSLLTLTLNQGFGSWLGSKEEDRAVQMTDEELANRIALALKPVGMTKDEILDKSGMSSSQFSRGIAVLKERNRVLSYRRKLAQGVHVKVWSLQ